MKMKPCGSIIPFMRETSKPATFSCPTIGVWSVTWIFTNVTKTAQCLPFPFFPLSFPPHQVPYTAERQTCLHIIYIYIFIHICTNVHIPVHIYIYIYISIYMYTYMHICKHPCIYLSDPARYSPGKVNRPQPNRAWWGPLGPVPLRHRGVH